VWPYVQTHSGDRAIGLRQRAPSIVQGLLKSSGREDDVGLFIFGSDLIGLSEGGIASCIHGEQQQDHGRKTAILVPN